MVEILMVFTWPVIILSRLPHQLKAPVGNGIANPLRTFSTTIS
jgi:hypothetical protein